MTCIDQAVLSSTTQHQQEMDDADSELKGDSECLHYHVRRAYAAALNENPITHNRGHP